MSYHLDWIELVCPVCNGELEGGASQEPGADASLTCLGCRRVYAVVMGIPDLRIFPDPYISALGDQMKGLMLAAQFEQVDLLGMARTYYHVTPETPTADVERSIVRLANAERRAHATVVAWDNLFGRLEGGAMLEVGCGTAPLLLATRSRYPHQIGVDVSFRWLVMAKRRLADAGVSVPLVAACGEALPFRAGTFDAVTMDSFLEITKDQDAAVKEAARVLLPGGRLVIATPNRWSMGPDPHIGVPAGGFLPNAVVNAIAKQRMARPPFRRLLTARALRRKLGTAGLQPARVGLAPVSEAQLSAVGALGRLAGGWYNRLRTVPVLRQMLLVIGPMLQADARKT